MLVSVVIASYNHSAYVAQAIESVLDQDWSEIDLVVIDDGSKDGSPEIISALLARRGGFRFVARENRGALATFRELLDMARGDLFCLLASDDYLPPGSLACRAGFLAAHSGHVAVFADGFEVDETTGNKKRILDGRRRRLFDLADPVPEFLQGLSLPIHTLMARTMVLRRIGGFDPRYRRCEDLDIQLLLFLQGQVGFVDEAVYCYRVHGANVSLANPDIARVDKVLCFNKYLYEVPELVPYRRLIRRMLRRHYLRLARCVRRSGGSAMERKLLSGAWPLAWQDPRLFGLLILLGIERPRQSSSSGSCRAGEDQDR